MAGRKSGYNKKLHDELVYWMARAGLTDKQMADRLGVVESTFHKWKLDFPSFSESIKDGKNTPDDQVESALLKKALGYERDGKYYPSDTTSMIFWLKNRRPARWRDRQDMQHTGDVDINIRVKHVKPDDSRD